MSLNLGMSSTGVAPAALQWTVPHTATNFTSVVIAAGPAATAAGKGIACASNAAGTTCILAGVNTNTISNGVVATATFQVSGTASGSISIPVTGVVGARVDGVELSSSGTGGAITVSSAPTPAPTPTVGISQLSCVPGSVTGPAQVSCTVGLNTTVTSSTTVSLSSNNAALTVPAFITLAAGSNSGTFNAAAASVQTNTTARVTATLNGTSGGADVTVLTAVPVPAPTPTMSVSQLSCAPGSVTGPSLVTCTVRLNTAATTSTTVLLFSNHFALIVPSVVTMAAGSNSSEFNAATASVQTNITARVTATLNGTSAGTDVTVLAPAPAPTPVTVSQLSCAPANVTGPAQVSCTVGLNTTVTSSTAVSLSSNHASLTVPTSVTVAVGSNSGTFNGTAGSVQTNTTARVTATLNGSSAGTDVTIVASAPSVPAVLSSLTCTPSVDIGVGGTSTCIVGLDKAATSSFPVTIASFGALVPPSVVVASGRTSVSFTLTRDLGLWTSYAVVTASAGGVVRAVFITFVNQLSSAICNPDSLTTPAGTQCTVEQAADSRTSPLPRIDRVVNVAAVSSEAACSPGSTLSILGSGLTSRGWEGESSGRVLINGEQATIVAASVGRLTFMCPSIRLGPELTITVENEYGSSNAISIPMREAAPVIFTMDDIRPDQGMMVVRETGQIAGLPSAVAQTVPARPGDLVSLFATGLGAVPLDPNGEFEDNAELRSRIQLLIDGFPAEVTFVGAAAGLPGIYQVDARIPGAVTRGEVAVEIRMALIDGQMASSNQATIIVEDQYR